MFRTPLSRAILLSATALIFGLSLTACQPLPLPASAESQALAAATVTTAPASPTPTTAASATAPAPATASPSAPAAPSATPAPTETVAPTELPAQPATVALTGPVVAITAPATGAEVPAGQAVTLQSFAQAAAGVARIDLWADGALYISSAAGAQAALSLAAAQTWSSTTPGRHTLTVQAYDTLGRASAAASITLVIPNAAPPAAWFVQPDPLSGPLVIQAGEAVTLAYAASAEAGVACVELWLDGQWALTEANDSLSQTWAASHSWSSEDFGEHTLVLRVYDAQGQMSESAPQLIGVTDRNPPVVSLNYPAPEAVVPAGQALPIVVSASDTKGITRVALWVDGAENAVWTSASLVGETPAAVTLNWLAPAAGSHTLFVIASDSVGQVTASAPVIVTVTP